MRFLRNTDKGWGGGFNPLTTIKNGVFPLNKKKMQNVLKHKSMNLGRLFQFFSKSYVLDHPVSIDDMQKK